MISFALLENLCRSYGSDGTSPYTPPFFTFPTSTLPPPPLRRNIPNNPKLSADKVSETCGDTSSAKRHKRKHLPNMRLFDLLLILSKLTFHMFTVVPSRRGNTLMRTFHFARKRRSPTRSNSIPKWLPGCRFFQPASSKPLFTGSIFTSQV